ncbi:hypothetical protein CC86DRAFT_468196 [Ophiobolus disseminans]|uniref:Uncharacterized protein n=1 Tax=Ophiobolus disseminans TaxID=1469910 RepID=A0A6A6ZV26_9PLEO|nr:hypothetical protein CC86DRAFT_468196 [Ophiobolus disseminans]
MPTPPVSSQDGVSLPVSKSLFRSRTFGLGVNVGDEEVVVPIDTVIGGAEGSDERDSAAAEDDTVVVDKMEDVGAGVASDDTGVDEIEDVGAGSDERDSAAERDDDTAIIDELDNVGASVDASLEDAESGVDATVGVKEESRLDVAENAVEVGDVLLDIDEVPDIAASTSTSEDAEEIALLVEEDADKLDVESGVLLVDDDAYASAVLREPGFEELVDDEEAEDNRVAPVEDCTFDNVPDKLKEMRLEEVPGGIEAEITSKLLGARVLLGEEDDVALVVCTVEDRRVEVREVTFVEELDVAFVLD